MTLELIPALTIFYGISFVICLTLIGKTSKTTVVSPATAAVMFTLALLAWVGVIPR